MQFDLTEALTFARNLAHETAQYLVHGAGKGAADTKVDGSYVTQYDLASDRRITAAIRSRFPSHGVLSEEVNKKFAGEPWCWIIDPIDGTTNFTWGFPLWGVLIGLLHNGVPVVGVGDFPLTGEQFYGATGMGAWCNDRVIKASAATAISPQHFFGTCSRTMDRMRLPVVAKTRIAGSTGYDMAKLADGTFVGIYNTSVAVWDVAPLWPLVQEAGAHVATATHGEAFALTPGTDYGDSATSKFILYGGCTREVYETVREKFVV